GQHRHRAGVEQRLQPRDRVARQVGLGGGRVAGLAGLAGVGKNSHRDQASAAWEEAGTYSVNTSATLCPPKPNASLRAAIGAPATRGASERGLVATSMARSSSGSSRLMVGGAVRSTSAMIAATVSPAPAPPGR